MYLVYHVFSAAMPLKTRIINVNPELIEPEKIALIAAVLKSHGVAVLPTETFYGIGANCFSEKAVKRVFALKKRDETKPLSLVISDEQMLEEIVTDIPPIFRKIAADFWPGPLTVVLKAAPNLPQELTGWAETVGVRLPDHPWLRALIRKAGFPLTATSANLSGEKETADPSIVLKVFSGKVDLIADGGMTSGRLPSTVLDLSGQVPKILREGAVTASALHKYLD